MYFLRDMLFDFWLVSFLLSSYFPVYIPVKYDRCVEHLLNKKIKKTSMAHSVHPTGFRDVRMNGRIFQIMKDYREL